MKKTGQLLKDKREAANFTISEVALATKINPKILSAIENGEEKNLPAKTFLKGFLRSYAVYLKLDAEEVLRLYQEESGAPAPVAQVRVEPQAKAATGPSGGRRRMDEENSSGLRTAAVIVIVLLIGVIIGVRELIEKYQHEKVLESSQIKVSPLEQPPLMPASKPPEGTSVTVAAPTPLESPAAPVVGTPASDVVPAPEAEVKPAQNEVTVNPPASTQGPLTAPTPLAVAIAAPTPSPAAVAKAAVPLPAIPAPVVAAAPVKVPPPVPPPAPAVAPTQAAAPTKATVPPQVAAAAPVPKVEAPSKPIEAEPASPVKNVKSEIILEALDKVEVKFQIKGETKKLSLAPTQVHTIRSDQPVIFDFSDGGAVNIILNGRERGPAGELGKPKQIKIP